MPYVLQPDSSTNPILKRVDHIISYVPDIERIHRHFVDVLGFAEAWPIGKFWPSGNTSGVALGGMNLEFVEKPGTQPIASTLVFEANSFDDAASALATKLEITTSAFEKIESNPKLLRLRGFSEEEAKAPQIICRNLLLESEFPIEMFFCEYSPSLKERLAPNQFPKPYGRVLRIEMELPKSGDIWKLHKVSFGGNIELHQSDTSFGPCRITGIMMENGPIELKSIDPGFSFI